MNDRLPPKDVVRFASFFVECGAASKCGDAGDKKLIELREMYEPYLNGLVLAPSDAASVLGRGRKIRGKLEAFGVGKDLLGVRGLWTCKRRIQPFLGELSIAAVSLVPMRRRAGSFANFLEIRKIAGGRPARILALQCKRVRLNLVVRFRKYQFGIDRWGR